MAEEPPKRVFITGGTTEGGSSSSSSEGGQLDPGIDSRQDQAILVVNGQEYRDWQTIMVRRAIAEQPPFIYRFTCSEATPIAKNFRTLQIKPSDVCKVYLGGELAITGNVMSRQVYYDKARHYIEIMGGTTTEVLASASPVTKTMEMKDVTFEQICRQCLKPFGIPLKIVGQLSQIKFSRVSFSHGLSVFDHLDLYGRAVNARFTSDSQGSFVVLAPGSSTSDGDTLTEGIDILVGRELIYNPSMATSTPQAGQGPGSDKKSGPEVSHKPFFSQEMQNFSDTYMPFTIPFELPTSDNQMLQGRGQTERDMNALDQITVFATVNGWKNRSGRLWDRDKKVRVNSPMLMMDGSIELKTKSVTFTQDVATGTRTTLELCNENALTGQTPQATNPNG